MMTNKKLREAFHKTTTPLEKQDESAVHLSVGLEGLDWLMENKASLKHDYFLGEEIWRVTVKTGHGCIATGKTPHEAMEKAIKRWAD